MELHHIWASHPMEIFRNVDLPFMRYMIITGNTHKC